MASANLSLASSVLAKPIRVGRIQLSHRIAMAPMTRFRASKEHVVNEAAAEYYSQRATPAGTLLITEGIFIAPKAGGYAHVPGIWSDEQIAVWKRVRCTSSPHEIF